VFNKSSSLAGALGVTLLYLSPTQLGSEFENLLRSEVMLVLTSSRLSLHSKIYGSSKET